MEQQIPQSPSLAPGPSYLLTQHNQAQKELFLFAAQLGKLFHPASPPGTPGAWRLQLCPRGAVPKHCPDFPVQIQNTAGLRFIPLALLPFLVFQQFLVLGQSRSRERPQLRAVHGVFLCVPSTKTDTCVRAIESK